MMGVSLVKSYITPKGFQRLIILLVIVTMLFSTYLKHPQWILVILGSCYAVLSAYIILSIKATKLKGFEKIYHYKSSFIGVDYWTFLFVWILIGLSKVYDDLILEGAIFIIISLTELAERIVKNRRKKFNVIFEEDKIIVNEDIHNEILYNDISSIEIVDAQTFKIQTRSTENSYIFNVNRITKSLRKAFVEELNILQSTLNKIN